MGNKYYFAWFNTNAFEKFNTIIVDNDSNRFEMMSRLADELGTFHLIRSELTTLEETTKLAKNEFLISHPYWLEYCAVRDCGGATILGMASP